MLAACAPKPVKAQSASTAATGIQKPEPRTGAAPINT